MILKLIFIWESDAVHYLLRNNTSDNWNGYQLRRGWCDSLLQSKKVELRITNSCRPSLGFILLYSMFHELATLPQLQPDVRKSLKNVQKFLKMSKNDSKMSEKSQKCQKMTRKCLNGSQKCRKISENVQKILKMFQEWLIQCHNQQMKLTVSSTNFFFQMFEWVSLLPIKFVNQITQVS